jgi:hypothetical protein
VVGGGDLGVGDGPNEAYANYSVVVGGWGNFAGDGVSHTTGESSTILGGKRNDVRGKTSSIGGGEGLLISTESEWVGSLYVSTASSLSLTNTTPEAYRLSIPPVVCDATTRGQIYIARPSANGSQDGICYCGNIDGNYRVNCFTP